jgi:hypothetical protein
MTSPLELPVDRIDRQYDLEDGFLGKLRSGSFDAGKAAELLDTLRELDLGDATVVDRRLVSLLWYMPLFIEWQGRRLPDDDQAKLNEVLNFVTTELQRILGVP